MHCGITQENYFRVLISHIKTLTSNQDVNDKYEKGEWGRELEWGDDRFNAFDIVDFAVRCSVDIIDLFFSVKKLECVWKFLKLKL